jgi:hypothetical protein
VQDLVDNFVNNCKFTNILQYKEKVNALLHLQFGGVKLINFRILQDFFRWEDSNIEINQFTKAYFHNKRYK